MDLVRPNIAFIGVLCIILRALIADASRDLQANPLQLALVPTGQPGSQDVVVFGAVINTNNEVQTPLPDPFEGDLVSDELLVRHVPGSTQTAKNRAIRGKGRKKGLLSRESAVQGDLVLVKVFLEQASDRAKLRATAAHIAQDESVLYVEPNYLATGAQAVTDDTLFNQLWGMSNSSAGGANAVGAWLRGYTDCSGVVIGVVDMGIDVNHEDLAPHIWEYPREVPGDGIDNDGNGFVDDINGWDFAYNDSTVYDGPGFDNHGTHVSGTIAGVGNNGKGVVGVCHSGIKLISAKFLDHSNWGTYANAILAMDYLRMLKLNYSCEHSVRHSCKDSVNLIATSQSWIGSSFSTPLADAVTRQEAAGILLMAAAGNTNQDNDVRRAYPANFPNSNIISVGALDSSGVRASYSSWGRTSVDIFGPGTNVVSTLGNNTYGNYSGTSMATPHVTGAAALYAAYHNDMTGAFPDYATIKAAVLASAKPNANIANACVTGGQLDIGALMARLGSATAPLFMRTRIDSRINLIGGTANRPRNFTCTFTLTVADMAGVSIPNASVRVRVSINPDNTNTDGGLNFPYTSSGVSGADGKFATTSPMIPSKFSLGGSGTNCKVDVLGVTHNAYVFTGVGSTQTLITARY